MDKDASLTDNKVLLFNPRQSLKELYLSGNPIGDSGTTALAAAFKISPSIGQQPVIDTLDISSCEVGDVGVEALSIAIIHNPGCVKRLYLSNNKITNAGAIALAKASRVSQQKLMSERINMNCSSSSIDRSRCYAIDTLDLSNNEEIDDQGAIALFRAVGFGAIRNLLLRSCSIHHEGVSSLGDVLAQMIMIAKSRCNTHSKEDSGAEIPIRQLVHEINIDISGNKIGVKKLKKKAGVSEKMMKNVNSIGLKGFGLLKSGFKDITSSLSSSSCLESDDEAEDEDDSLIESNQSQVSDKCGAISLYDSFIECIEHHADKSPENEDSNENHNNDKDEDKNQDKVIISLGMRMCNLDNAALDALAAIKTCLKNKLPKKEILISFDCEMNNVDDERKCLEALLFIEEQDHEDEIQDHKALNEMTERHLEAIESRRRAFESKEAESRLNGLFGDDHHDCDHFDDSEDEYNNGRSDFYKD